MVFICLLGVVVFNSCTSKQKSEEEENSFFPVVSFLKSQVAHVDTSFYRIVKVEQENGRSDTSYLKREEFKIYAKEFTSIPDISSDDLKDEYAETKLYDEALERVVLSYTPKENDAEIQRQDITILPDNAESKVETIYIDQLYEEGDSIVQKKMLWRMDKKFQITTSVSKSGQPERLKTVQVSWSTFAN